MTTLPPARAVVVDPDPSWATRARRLAGQLRDALGPDAPRVEHIGSTAIPGMAAKDVLDMQVSVDSLAVADTGTWDAALAGLGFARTPYERDHVPAGRDDDPDSWAKLLWSRRGYAEPDVNLHVRVAGSGNERLALLFRDWFRAHPAAVAGYARFKRVLADHTPDVGTYSDVKDPVVDVIVAVAEEWAATTGWHPAYGSNL